MDNTKQYVVLRHLTLPDRGLCFFTMNCHREGSTSECENNTHGYTGELWYEEVGFADTIEEAQKLCSEKQLPTASFQELYDYHREQSRKRDLKIGEMFRKEYE